MAGLQDNTLRIVLVGKTGSGKSGTANTILGRREFESKIAAHAVTKSSQKASREWKGRQLLVVDTPGLFDTKETLQTTYKEISRCVVYSCPGPHAIVLVMRLGRYTEEEQKTVALVKAVFGKEAMKHMIVLFTRKDWLEDQSLEDFIRNSDDKLRNLVKECGDRCCAFDNRSKDKAEKEAQVQELVEIIDRMVRGNGGAYFSGDMYKDIEKRLQRQEEVLKKIYADQLQKEILLVEKEYAAKLMEEKEERIKQVKMKYKEKIKNIKKEAEKNVFAEVLDRICNRISKIWHMFWK